MSAVQKVDVRSIYTTRRYVRDMVSLARQANRSGVRSLKRARMAVTCKSLFLGHARASFSSARKCLNDARAALVRTGSAA